MDKKTTFIFSLTYIITTGSLLTAVPYGDWTSHIVIGLIAGTAGATAIYIFFSSNRKNIDEFMREPSFKKAGNILLTRQKLKKRGN